MLLEMKNLSAGILLFRKTKDELEVFLVHPGGPLWAKRDAGAWSIPKGEYGNGDDPLQTAKREFEEETGVDVDGDFLPLGSVKQAGGKIVTAWALEARTDIHWIRSNTFDMEWPPRSGRMQKFPEVDKAEWFRVGEAKTKILASQTPFLIRLISVART
jgi:predicted NUDIX family NTP pyrophosphohydrolase